MTPDGIKELTKTRLRIRFTKTGDLRWIGHRDLARLWERLLRRANLQLAFSEGFHPKPRISFPSALALGIESLDEIVELEVVGEVELEAIEQDIRAEMPSGMELLSLESPAYGLGKAKFSSATYGIVVPEDELEAVEQRIRETLELQTIDIPREKKVVSCSVGDPRFSLQLDGCRLEFGIPNIAEGSIRPSELLEFLGLGDLLESGATLTRIQVHLVEPQIKEVSGN